MKTRFRIRRVHRCRQPGGWSNRRAAFTLLEMLTTVAVFLLTVTAVLSSHIMGLKMYNISAAKLGASAGARSSLNQIRNEVRAGKLLFVGNGNADGFSRIKSGAPQIGNALQVYPSVNTNIWVRFYLDAKTQSLRRATSGGSTEVVASYITNTSPFSAENYAGTVLTNDTNHRLVRMLLEFYQWEFPIAKAGGHYDYYRLQTRITRRTIE